MKKGLILALLMLVCFVPMVKAENAETEDGLWMIKSWSDLRTSKYYPLGVGLCTYTDKYHDWEPAAYGHVSFIGYEHWVKLNVGVVIPHLENEGSVRVTFAYGLTTVFEDLIGDWDIEVGAYTGHSASRNPWGIMLGLAF